MDILAVISIPFDPDIIRRAGFVLSWHGFFTVVAVAVAVYLTWRWGRRDGLNGDAILSVATWCIIGGIIGARILHVIDFWDDVYRHNPVRVIYFWSGGIAIFGAYLGGFAGGAAYILLRNAPWLHRLCDHWPLRWTGMHRPFPELPSVAHLADVAAPALLIALAIGRIGDVINGEHWSSFTDLPWGWVYTDPDSLGYNRPPSPSRGSLRADFLPPLGRRPLAAARPHPPPGDAFRPLFRRLLHRAVLHLFPARGAEHLHLRLQRGAAGGAGHNGRHRAPAHLPGPAGPPPGPDARRRPPERVAAGHSPGVCRYQWFKAGLHSPRRPAHTRRRFSVAPGIRRQAGYASARAKIGASATDTPGIAPSVSASPAPYTHAGCAAALATPPSPSPSPWPSPSP